MALRARSLGYLISRPGGEVHLPGATRGGLFCAWGTAVYVTGTTTGPIMSESVANADVFEIEITRKRLFSGI